MRHSRSTRVLVTLVLTLLLASAAAPALAAPVALRGIGVVLYDIGFGKTATLVVSGVLPEDAALPATVELPVPAGSDIGWVGEVFGGDQSQDMVADYTVRAGDGYDVLVVTVTAARVIQAELAPPDGWLVERGETADLAMTWTADADVPGVLMGFELDASLHAERLVPSSAAASLSAGGVRYSYETTPVAAGTVLTLQATLAEGADPLVADAAPAPAAAGPVAAPAQTAAPTEAILVGVLGAIALALTVVVVVLIRRQNASRGT